LKVYFCHSATPEEQAAAGFGVKFEWDVPLLDGYEYQFLQNHAAKPDLHKFNGIDTPEIADLIYKSKFDAVLVSGWNYKAAWQTFLACWRSGTPVMVRGDSHLYTSRSMLKKAAKYPFYRWFIQRMDACLAVGKWSREYYRHYGAKDERIFFVPHVVNYDYFQLAIGLRNEKRSDLRQMLQISDRSFVFLFCGKLVEIKRPYDFLEAITSSSQSRSQILGVVVGDGLLRSIFKGTAQPNVNYLGFKNQTELLDIYAVSNAIVMTSASETWGLVVNEAMAAGVPALVSDQVGCHPDLVIPDVTGNTFPMGDVNALAALMGDFATNPQKTAQMGMNAHHHVLANYGMKQAVNGVLEAMSFIKSKKVRHFA
jgi:glycosyltransferase involved in cell wall biosynthesis